MEQGVEHADRQRSKLTGCEHPFLAGLSELTWEPGTQTFQGEPLRVSTLLHSR